MAESKELVCETCNIELVTIKSKEYTIGANKILTLVYLYWYFPYVRDYQEYLRTLSLYSLIVVKTVAK
jgi:hypothetical protein